MSYVHSMLGESAGTDFSSSRGTRLSTAFQGSVEGNIDDKRSLLQCKTNFLWLSGRDWCIKSYNIHRNFFFLFQKNNFYEG